MSPQKVRFAGANKDTKMNTLGSTHLSRYVPAGTKVPGTTAFVERGLSSVS